MDECLHYNLQVQRIEKVSMFCRFKGCKPHIVDSEPIGSTGVYILSCLDCGMDEVCKLEDIPSSIYDRMHRANFVLEPRKNSDGTVTVKISDFNFENIDPDYGDVDRAVTQGDYEKAKPDGRFCTTDEGIFEKVVPSRWVKVAEVRWQPEDNSYIVHEAFSDSDND